MLGFEYPHLRQKVRRSFEGTTADFLLVKENQTVLRGYHMNLDELYSRVSETISSLNFGRIWPGFRPLKFALYDDEKCFFEVVHNESSFLLLAKGMEC